MDNQFKNTNLNFTNEKHVRTRRRKEEIWSFDTLTQLMTLLTYFPRHHAAIDENLQ